MAQIIKHRRGSITQLKDVTARVSELVVATGSIGSLNGPFLFVGETEGVAGAYRPVSKIYQGASAPTITVGSYGSTLDGTPFYSSGDKSLYILSQAGNSKLDFTGNIEGNTISNVTITSLTGSNANYLNLTGTTFTSTNANITSLTGSNGNFTNLSGGTLNVTGQTYLGGDLNITGNTYQTGSIDITGDITLGGNITIGNQTTDIIQFGGEVSSSILPIVHNSFDLGSPTKNWRNLHVSGTAYVNILEAQSISLDGITVFQDLVVSGSSYLGEGGGDNVIISGSVYIDSLTETRVPFAGAAGQLTDNSGFTFAYNGDYNANVLSAPIINATNDGNGTNFLVGNDVWIGDVNQANTMMFKGAADANYTKVLLNDSSGNNYLEAQYSTVKLSANNSLYLQSQNDTVNIDAYDGNLNLNNDSGNNVTIGGHTYINNHNLYVNRVFDNSNLNNYLELKGWNTDDGYWWESGNGADTTLLNSENGSNLNILQRNNGNVNIDATQGSVNIHSANGMNVTGSLIVSDASGVFNSSLITSNSDLYLESGSNQHMMNGAHLYFDTCVDIYYDNNDGNLIFYNDCNNFQFRNNISVTGSLNVSSGLYSDNYRGATNSDNALHLNGGTFGASQVELTSTGRISLFSEGGGSDYAINLTGSVYSNDDITIKNNNALYTTYVNALNGGALNLQADSDVNIYSDSSRVIQLSVNNAEAGTNYLHVNGDGVDFSTYDYTSGLTHKATLDNTGSLKLNNINVQISGSLGVDGNTTYNNDLTVGGDMYVSGNFTVLGTGSIINLTGSQVDFGTNVINLNTYAPFERFAGINVFDSGSNAGVTGSLLWDSQNNVWIYANPSGSSYASARFIAGPQNSGSLGQETGLTAGHFPIAQSDDHIMDSLLTYLDTTLALNVNKFTVDSDTGDTVIAGNFTLHGEGGTDNGQGTSYVIFRNSDDIAGFIDSNDTHNELTQVLGYNTSTGVLEFSSLIDGGTY